MKRITLFLSLITLPFLSGCWDQHELDELSIVMGIGIDRAENGDMKASYQIVNPSEVSPGLGGGGGKQPNFTVYTSNGKNLMEATRNASRQTPRRLFFAHARILVLSEKVVKEKGIYDALDMISRDPEVRSTIQVFIARNTDPATILETFSAIDKVSADEVASKLDVSEKVWGENIGMDINEVLQSIISQGSEPLINGLSLRGDPEQGVTAKNYEAGKPARLYLNGMAVFKHGKLKKWADGSHARGLVFVKDNINSSVINLDCEGKKDSVAIEIVRSKVELKADMKGEIPRVKVSAYPETNIAEANCPADFENKDTIFNLEKLLNKEVEKEIKASIKFVQKQNTDVIGFGELLYRTDPKKWRSIRKNWDKTFPKIEVTVEVYSRIRRPGIRTSPFQYELKNEADR
jgi:spore germination protein KC